MTRSSLALAFVLTSGTVAAAPSASTVLKVEPSSRPVQETLLDVAYALRAVHGVECVHLRMGPREVRVTYDAGVVGLPAIVTALERAGFRARREKPLPATE